MALRLKAMGQPNYKNGFKPTIHPNSLALPLTWKQPQIIFVNSMSDLFHEAIPNYFIKDIFRVMNEASWHTFQILTKRSKRFDEIKDKLEWTDNIWMGVTVENENLVYRIDDLRKCNAKIKFLSLEPLLGPINGLNLRGIDWVIVGGESGPGARPMEEEWAIQIRDVCVKSHVPLFFKQWGGVRKKAKGRLLQGKYWNELPSPIFA
jgi:protein gp37